MKEFASQLVKDKVGLIGAIGILLIVIVSLFASVIAPFSPEKMYTDAILQSPNATYFFGTDEFGRDIFSRIIYGAQVSVKVSVIAVGIGATLGLIFGLISGYFQGKVDSIIMRMMDVLFPFSDIIRAWDIFKD